MITSPIDGIVISRNVDVGQTVAASMQAPTLFVLAADLTKMQVVANLDESDVGRIRPGQPVRFRVDAYPTEDFAGAVSQVRLQPQVVQNVVTYSTVIDVPNPELQLKPGMTANVNIEIARRSNVAPHAERGAALPSRRTTSSPRSARRRPSRPCRSRGEDPADRPRDRVRQWHRPAQRAGTSAGVTPAPASARSAAAPAPQPSAARSQAGRSPGRRAVSPDPQHQATGGPARAAAATFEATRGFRSAAGRADSASGAGPARRAPNALQRCHPSGCAAVAPPRGRGAASRARRSRFRRRRRATAGASPATRARASRQAHR